MLVNYHSESCVQTSYNTCMYGASFLYIARAIPICDHVYIVRNKQPNSCVATSAVSISSAGKCGRKQPHMNRVTYSACHVTVLCSYSYVMYQLHYISHMYKPKGVIFVMSYFTHVRQESPFLKLQLYGTKRTGTKYRAFISTCEIIFTKKIATPYKYQSHEAGPNPWTLIDRDYNRPGLGKPWCAYQRL